jgi:type II secretory pathway pseudopilin PulG
VRTRVPTQAREQGFTLLELTVSATVSVIAFGALMTNLVVGIALRESTREMSLAIEGAQTTAEILRSGEFDTLFAQFNSNPNDDPDGVGTATGSGFAVPGLSPTTDDVDGLPGEILFPGDGTALLESVDDSRMGMPRDLNADGIVDLFDHSPDYTNLPVRIRVTWRGRGGTHSIDIVTSLSDL